MRAGLIRATREIYRRELVPERILWWLSADGMRDWFRVLAKRLAPHLAAEGTPPIDAKVLLSSLAARTFERRWDALRSLSRQGVRVRTLGGLPDRAREPRAVALLMSALYRVESAPKSAWIFDGLGGAPRGPAERLRARVLLSSMGVRDRWGEVGRKATA